MEKRRHIAGFSFSQWIVGNTILFGPAACQKRRYATKPDPDGRAFYHGRIGFGMRGNSTPWNDEVIHFAGMQ
jgi:hypothetical protein